MNGKPSRTASFVLATAAVILTGSVCLASDAPEEGRIGDRPVLIKQPEIQQKDFSKIYRDIGPVTFKCKAGYTTPLMSEFNEAEKLTFKNFCGDKVGQTFEGRRIESVHVCAAGLPIPANACADNVAPLVGGTFQSKRSAYIYSCVKETEFSKTTCGKGFEVFGDGQFKNVCLELVPKTEAGDKCLKDYILEGDKCCTKSAFSYSCRVEEKNRDIFPTLETAANACLAGTTAVNTSVEGWACCAKFSDQTTD